MTRPGLCASCAHVQIVSSSKGSTFFLCGLAETDPRFVKYPRLPVLHCDGYRDAGSASAPDDDTDSPVTIRR